MKQTFKAGVPHLQIPGLAKWKADVPDNNPPARARIHSVCAKLRSATGKPSLSIAPRCRHTIKDCELVVWNEEGLAEREWRQGPEMMRTHCMAGAGYMIFARSPYGKDASKETPLPKVVGTPIKTPRTGI